MLLYPAMKTCTMYVWRYSVRISSGDTCLEKNNHVTTALFSSFHTGLGHHKANVYGIHVSDQNID